ncbi:DUF5995 family protein [Chryseobacterium balustinum]|uniref:Uncharacterized protein n=1 Tax=Chryseobacterium balustinum TaxID=246 RepID=A0AAX2IR64_9FLAO|nr:DUF5995 family protein [Chryseobacterium balustinum]AZB31020.1 hypothetical protein EB354_18115 [Chryseobacterium balustinum]SKB41363.1 hypothetical protein SAMN05421800_101542 [Chryseobacterium balustinum]SQA92237.1 Uncharacterised protein [Chryseobacterium balustinum]
MKTIEEVLKKLDEIILWSKADQSPIGYFACTYRMMTAQVLKGIQQKKFEDNSRMTLLDIDFATRYLDAWENYSKGKKCTNSWYLAFEAAKNKDLLILQHIFLGMNAHINLDLGISAASIMPYRKINPLKKDFENINSVIASINQNVQDSLNKICYPINLIDKLSNGKDNAVLDFAISKARDTSWATAVISSNTPNFLKESVINIVDYAAAKVASQILNPKLLSSTLAKELKKCESSDVVKNIEILEKTKIN